MALYRTIQLSFWTDTKVVDNFTPEDRYFYLYLMTNPHTNLVGCYEVSIKQMSDESGYSKDVVERLIDRMEKTHDVIRYNKNTKELLILNWGKYNWTKSPKLKPAIVSGIQSVKTPEFNEYLSNLYESVDTVSIPYTYGSDTSVTVTDTTFNNLFRQIIDYLNTKANTRYKYTSDKYRKSVHARVEEGFVLNDFMEVIDKKCAEWIGTEWEKFLRPETLFGTKFESYLNQKVVKKEAQQETVDEWLARKEREQSDSG